MSNLGQFTAKAYPAGSSISWPNSSWRYVNQYGLEYYSTSYGAPAVAYTSDYAYLPSFMKYTQGLVTGPETDGLWKGLSYQIAYNPDGPLYVTAAYGYDSQAAAFYYYTSTDLTSWTKRYFPVIAANPSYSYTGLIYTNGKFMAFAWTGSSTNSMITSTNGIDWTQSNGPAVSASLGGADIVSDGANNVVILQTSGASVFKTTDGGTTWASSNLVPSTTPTGGIANASGSGLITYNAGAGLYIIASVMSTPFYQTSTNGATWIQKSPPSFFSAINYLVTTSANVAIKFASNATTTIVMGANGFYAHTTDGITWNNHGFVAKDVGFGVLNAASGPNNFYYDGTRFICRYGRRLFYSTDGLSWTETSCPNFAVMAVTNGMAFGYTTANGSGASNVFKVDDVTSTTIRSVMQPIAVSQATSNTSAQAFVSSHIRAK